MSTECPSENQFVERAKGVLHPAEIESMDAHIASCSQCAQVLVDLARLLEPRDIHSASGESRARICGESVAFPRHLGRYVVGKVIGSGGMGVVYAGYDPELDRKVALKVLHKELMDSEEVSAIILREARAMARFNHPSVVTIHDVGTSNGTVFVAMELVDGTTARAWLHAQNRSVREILEVYIQAADGLNAVHRAGLIHRDVKPENILVRRTDGRALVTDFGLARAIESATETPRLFVEAGASPRVGSAVPPSGVNIVGTPRYMSPEQRLGRPVTHRSDQFSLCAALYEALYGKLPTFDEAIGADDNAVPKQERTPAAWRRRIPRRVRAALARGLACCPEDRHESVAALIHQLGPDRQVARWAALGGGMTVVGASAVLATTLSREPVWCPPDEAAAELAGVWDHARRAQLAASFSRLWQPHASSVYLDRRRSVFPRVVAKATGDL